MADLNKTKGLWLWCPFTNGNAKNQGLSSVKQLTFNGTVDYPDGKLGKCLHIRKVTTNATLISEMSGKLNYTICGWFKIDSAEYTQYKSVDYRDLLDICTGTSQSGATFRIEHTTVTGQVSICPPSGSWTLNTGKSIDINCAKDKWVHIAFTHDDSKCYLYINGDQIGYVSDTNTLSGYIGLGGISGESGSIFYCNDFRIYSYTLSPQEIKELSRGCVAQYPCDGADLYRPNLIAGSYDCSNKYTGTWRIVKNYGVMDNTAFYGTPAHHAYRTGQTTTSWSEFQFVMDASKLQPGKTYTLSYWAKLHTSGSTYGSPTLSGFRYYKTGDGNIYYGSTTTLQGFDSTKLDTWQRLEYQFTVPTETTNWCYLFITYGNNADYYIARPKIEEGGGQATPWSDYNQPLTAFLSDISGLGRHSSQIRGNVTLAADTPRYDKSLKFNGNSGIDIPSPFGARAIDELTISLWHKPNASSSPFKSIISNASPHSGFWLSTNCEGQPLWYYGGSWYVRASKFDDGTNITISNDQWYHIVLTYKNNTYKFYLNGKPCTTTTAGTFKAPTFQATLSLGCAQGTASDNGSSDYRQYGNLSDVRLYAIALSADDVKELYSLGH